MAILLNFQHVKQLSLQVVSCHAARDGEQGAILIDPEDIASCDLLRDSTNGNGGNSGGGTTWNAGALTLQADDSITINITSQSQAAMLPIHQIRHLMHQALQQVIQVISSSKLIISPSVQAHW